MLKIKWIKNNPKIQCVAAKIIKNLPKIVSRKLLAKQNNHFRESEKWYQLFLEVVLLGGLVPSKSKRYTKETEKGKTIYQKFQICSFS